ncbi:hypothetical protein HNP55_003036 [Paucibacter oligotrophus]|uniref:DoxX-like protein n=1 Tax=Roseateles oligotrophus TaxID=1769250 RepID=A0A840LCX0_9BURK|nr:hypothetical protein [Roseateles oligotrophus]MBB4844492.1 hypothetical protein [Roseateles oligotrophus]
MYVIAAIGLLTISLSCLMMASPDAWAAGILAFAQKPYFHAAEIITRVLAGGALVFFAEQTLHPPVFVFAGYVLVAVGAFLLLAGSSRHRDFAVRSASFKTVFRPAGVVGFAAGAFVIYSALGR